MWGIPEAPRPLSTLSISAFLPSLFSRSSISEATLSSHVPRPIIWGASRTKKSSPPWGQARLINNKFRHPSQVASGERLSVAVQGFHPSSFLAVETARLEETIRTGKAIAAVSGGVDSTVAALVAKKALGDRLVPVFIDTGFLRAGEPEDVKLRLADPAIGFKVIEPLSDLYKDQVRILGRHLNMPGDMSRRQPFPGPGLLVRCIGSVSKTKLNLLKHATKIVEEKLGPFNYEQYFPAVIENRFAKNPEFKDLKDAAAEALGLPASETHVDVFEDRVTGVKGDDRIYGRLAGIKIKEDSRETFGWLPEKLRQAQVSIINRSPEVTRVAVMVKERRGAPALSVMIRAVSTRDFMTAAVASVPWKILKDAAESILKTGGALRVYYDITPKPPATVEFE